MNEPIINTQAQAQSYLEKAETYKKLGLQAQVQHELEQARRIDPYIVHEDRYKTLLEENAQQVQKTEGLKVPLRVATGMLVINALLNTLFLVLIFVWGDPSTVGGRDIVGPIADVVIAVNLWQLKEAWKRYTVWWAVLGLVLFGLGSLISADYFSLIIQVGFSGALILLLAGTPSKAKTISSIAVFLVLYLGAVCLLLTLSMIGAVGGAS